MAQREFGCDLLAQGDNGIMASTRTISTRGRLTIALTPISIVLVASGPSLAHLGLVPPISGFNVFLTGLGLGVVAFVLGLSSLLGERKKKNLRRGWTAITSVLAFFVANCFYNQGVPYYP